MSPRLAASLTLAGTVLAAVALWGSLGQQLDVPTVFGDELIHWDASRSLAAGDGLRVRDGGYGFGPVYPALLAPVHLLAPDDLTAYRWARVWNAVLFALAAIPAYLLARRLLPPGWSLACAALAVLVPSALYTGFVMTEGAAYAACTLAFLAAARCLERPTIAAQVGALLALALAAGMRFQLATLGASFVAALAVRWIVARGWSLPSRGDLRRLWPLVLVLGAGAVALAVRAALGNPLAGYGDLWRTYDVVQVARWTWRGFAGLGLYLALVPLVVLPATLASLWRLGRAGNREAASFVSLFACVNAVLLLVVGAFTSTEFGVGYLHDRYLFYVAPLWILATAVWAHHRIPLGPASLGIGVLLVLVPLATLPTYLLNADGGRRFDAIAAGLPSQVAVHAGRAEPARWWLVGAGLLAIGFVVAVTRTSLPRWLVLVPIAAVFALDAGFAWHARVEVARNVTFSAMDAATVSWVDRAVPAGAEVATLAGGVPVETRDALRLTEFFNASIGPAYDLATGYAPTLAASSVRIGPGGRVVSSSGPVHSHWVVAPSGLELDGNVVAEGTVEGLRLWRTRAPLRVLEGTGS